MTFQVTNFIKFRILRLTEQDFQRIAVPQIRPAAFVAGAISVFTEAPNHDTDVRLQAS